MKNKEKAAIVDALKDRYTLPMILRKLEMPKSSYYYQKARSDRIDKYQELRKSINAAYYDNRACYGYRRIHAVLKKNGFTVSEKNSASTDAGRRAVSENQIETKIQFL